MPADNSCPWALDHNSTPHPLSSLSSDPLPQVTRAGERVARELEAAFRPLAEAAGQASKDAPWPVFDVNNNAIWIKIPKDSGALVRLRPPLSPSLAAAS